MQGSGGCQRLTPEGRQAADGHGEDGGQGAEARLPARAVLSPPHSPCTTPQGYCRARTSLFPTFTSSVLPTTAKGRCAWKGAQVYVSTEQTWARGQTHPRCPWAPGRGCPELNKAGPDAHFRALL